MASFREYKTQDGTRYEFYIYNGRNKGTGKQLPAIHRRGFRGIREAKKVATNIENELNRKNSDLINHENTRLSDYLIDWIEHLKINVKEGTLIIHRYNIEHYLIPRIGGFTLANYGPRDHQKFLETLLTEKGLGRSGKGLSYHTVSLINSTLSNAYSKAVKLGYVDRNPVALAEIPNKYKPDKHKHPLHFYSKTQVNAFLKKSAIEREYFWTAFFTIIFDAGLRKGEVMALKWSDIKFNKKMITINKERLYKKETPDTIVLDTTKTSAGTRTVPMTDRLLASLKDLFEHQHPVNDNKIVKLDNDDEVANEFLFILEHGRTAGNPVRDRTINEAFERIRKNANLPKIKVHDGRHTNGTLLRQSGVPLEDISDLLGHKDIATTRIYAESTDVLKKRSINTLNTFLNE